MLDIQIDKDYKITSDPRNFMLQRRTVPKEGKEKGKANWSTLSYHGTIESVLRAYKTLNIKESDATSIAMLLNEIEKIDKTINKVLKGV